MRLLAMIATLGATPVRLAYPSVKAQGRVVKAFAYFRCFWALLRRVRRLEAAQVLHATPLFGRFIRAELAILRAARSRGVRIVLDLRAGNKQMVYETRGEGYRRRFRAAVMLADVVAIEGERYRPFIQSIRPDVPIRSLPNFLLDADIPEVAPPRAPGPICFAYVGAVNEDKGALQAVRLVSALRARGVCVRFDIFGHARPDFAERLRDAAGGADWLVLHGPQPFEVIRNALGGAHFFLFLSKWHGEGHSNALTEAMSQGAIPVVTDHGFSRDVAGPDAILVTDREDLDGALAAVADLSSHTETMAMRAESLVKRVRDQFSETSVRPVLDALYRD
jgi:glycosyltransferase involved in cell wall biosynthesis